MNKPWLVVVWLLTLELLAILILIPGDWTARAIKNESVLVKQSLGIEAQDWIHNKATTWYQSSIIDSGFYDGMYKTLILRLSGRGQEGWRAWVRIGLWGQWPHGCLCEHHLPVLHPSGTPAGMGPVHADLVRPAIYDGWMTWKIKRTNFDYASPVLHRYSVRGTMFIMAGLFICFFIPFALDPVVIPLTMMACCVLVGLTVSNFQKRV